MAVGAFLRTQHARQVPFDNSNNGFPAAATNVQLAIESVLAFDPQSSTAAIFDDFTGESTWSPSTSGVGAVASQGGGNATLASGKHLGVMQIQYGTVLGFAGFLRSGNLQVSTVFGSGIFEYQTLLRIPTLATDTEDYTLRFGFGDVVATEPATGIYFEYQRSSSVNWRFKAATSSTRTTVTSSVAVTNNTWIHCKFVVNSAGNNVDFYLDGSLAGSITTNIPTTTGIGCGPVFSIIASLVVSGQRAAFFDYVYYIKYFTARD